MPDHAERIDALDGVEPRDVRRGLRASDGLVVLSGRWCGGGTVLAQDPLRVVTGTDGLDGVLRWPGNPNDPDALGGGWFGWLAYPQPTGPARHWFGLYPDLLRYRAGSRGWYAESVPGLVPEPQRRARRDALVARAVTAAVAGPAGYRVGPLTPGTARADYCAAVERCIEFIRAGEIYQANICLLLTAPFAGDPAPLYADLVDELAPDYAALVCSGATTVVSASPELFLARAGREIESAPIKGTRARTGAVGDDPNALALARSAKDRAENVMIVDLVRNDLARVARLGSVTVPDLLRVQAHCGVWHLVSRVRAELADGAGNPDLLAAAYPAGSITGAPKIAAQRVIETLEADPRGVYTGSVGYLAGDRVELNVAIRTLEIADRQLRLGVGAGITASSVPTTEWAECLDKARPLARVAGAALAGAAPVVGTAALSSAGVFETLLVLEGRPVELAAHLDRLRASADVLWDRPLPPQLGAALARPGLEPAARLRVDVRPGEAGALAWSLARSPVRAPLPIGADGGFDLASCVIPGGVGGHKWADRARIDAAEAAAGSAGGAGVLIVDDNGDCLETTRGSLFALTGERLVTPALDGRILPGVTRRVVLELAAGLGRPVEIRVVPMAELVEFDALAVAGSLSGMGWVRRAAGRTWARPPAALIELSERLIGRWHRR